jgi:hypothetical protein
VEESDIESLILDVGTTLKQLELAVIGKENRINYPLAVFFMPSAK